MLIQTHLHTQVDSKHLHTFWVDLQQLFLQKTSRSLACWRHVSKRFIVKVAQGSTDHFPFWILRHRSYTIQYSHWYRTSSRTWLQDRSDGDFKSDSRGCEHGGQQENKRSNNNILPLHKILSQSGKWDKEAFKILKLLVLERLLRGQN